jgi:hypothetical protein
VSFILEGEIMECLMSIGMLQWAAARSKKPPMLKSTRCTAQSVVMAVDLTGSVYNPPTVSILIVVINRKRKPQRELQKQARFVSIL